MRYGALIVAAGMSSRMGSFKPMLNIGSISVAQRVVATFHQAGISKIVMVTGFNATTLERHLSGNNIIFLRNISKLYTKNLKYMQIIYLVNPLQEIYLKDQMQISICGCCCC